MAALRSSPSDTPLSTALPSPVGHVMLWALATIFTIEVALYHLWPAPTRDQAMMMFGCSAAILSLMPIVARMSLMEITGRMEYGTLLGVAVFFVIAFFLPSTVLAREYPDLVFPMGFVALALPLSALIVFPRRCHYLLADLLLVWICLLGLRPDLPPVFPVVGLFLLTMAVGASQIHFRQVRLRRAIQSLSPAVIGTIALFGISLAFASAINWVVPDRWMERPVSTETIEADSTAIRPQTPVSSSDVRRVLFDMAVITILSLVFIVLLGRLIKRLRRKRRPIPVEGIGEDFITEHERIAARSRPKRRRGGSVRDKIIATYLDATDRMKRAGYRFPAYTTAEEFRVESVGEEFEGSAALRDLTDVFEQAKYGQAKMKPKDLKKSRVLAERVAEAMSRGE